MRLSVYVIEARNLPATDLNGSSDPYVRLQLGKSRIKTKVVKKSLKPSWNEEFSFRVEDLNEELTVSVLDEDKYFNDDFLGQLKVPVSNVFDAENKTLGLAWYPLQPKNKKLKSRDCGEILLTISLAPSTSFIDQMPTRTHSCHGHQQPQKEIPANITRELQSETLNGPMRDNVTIKDEKSYAQNFADRLVQLFVGRSAEPVPTYNYLQKMTSQPELPVNKIEDVPSGATFDEAMKTMESRDQGGEIPTSFPGVLLDQSYETIPADLNSLIFGPGSKFMKSLHELQGTTDVQEGSWSFENGGGNLKRIVTYTKAATKLIKAVKATEEQTYLKADGSNFAVLTSVSTPEVPYGSNFRVELLFCIVSGPESSFADQSSRLIISWHMNFLQSTIMRGMIEGGARQGLKGSYDQFAELLSQHVKPVDLKATTSDKEQVLASLQMEQRSDWRPVVGYFGKFTVVSAVFIGLYVFAHIMLMTPSTTQGLEFNGLDLPDSIGEVVVCGVLVLQAKHVLEMITHFMQARLQRGSDHGVKAQGDGWLLTVALLEGRSLAAVESTGFSDPYVVFTCNGKTRSSSIKFQVLDPLWNEIFEFDAMDEPPSTMEVEVFDFDGPFDEATSLGHAEINFLKSNLSELADIWIPLQGKLAQPCQSKLHLRIFLNNTRGTDVVREFLSKMEKEVGKKINQQSPQRNSAFQKLFGLPSEEFLINDFTCHLKRKMPVQGRLFLSPRIIGFHSNLFGHKTNFFFLWEDIEDILVLSPSLASVGSPTLVILLRRGRGLDAKHGAKAQDEEGRLKFHFQSFVSFHVGNRTIMALWKARSLSPEQKVQIVEEESELKTLQTEESGSFLSIEDASMSEVYSALLPVSSNLLVELFSGGDLEHRVMEKVGCLDYSCTPWELVKPGVCQRQICYKFDKCVSRYGGEVTSTQQKSPFPDKNGWVVEELHLKYQVEDYTSRSKASNVQVYLGIGWLKSTRHQKRITKNVISNLADRLKEMFSLVEKVFVLGKVLFH
ncbi:C2 and GRAM domain-containing protein At1g03370-like isoform X2 [Aristolochia californica]|uniref:C2 and GRAM domain-containing protein At1g03370-like isoform X2 n=1 Tax=Aristolochia californica TaxID=171875 RepID=UPI0035DEDCD2